MFSRPVQRQPDDASDHLGRVESAADRDAGQVRGQRGGRTVDRVRDLPGQVEDDLRVRPVNAEIRAYHVGPLIQCAHGDQA